MSIYEQLEHEIVERIANGWTTLAQIQCREVAEEAFRLGILLEREAFRIIDGRLQALRKRGVIEFRKGSGWVMVKT